MSKKAEIEEIITKEDEKHLPILLNFQNGKLSEKALNKSQFVVGKNKDTKSKEGFFSVKGENYYGSIQGNKDEPVKNYIAVKKGHKVHLIEIDQCTLKHESHQKSETSNNLTSKEMAFKILMKSFGGKKGNIYYDRQDRSKVNLDIIKNQINKTVDETVLQDEEDSPLNILDISPTYNVNATKANNLYNIVDILSEDYLNILNKEAESVFEFETKKLPIESEFILQEIERVKLILPIEKSHQYIKVLIYLDGLLNYIKIKKRTALHNIEFSKISDRISEDICKRFSPKDTTKIMRTGTSIDKAVCYFIVLLMLIQPNLELDINVLTTELGRSKVRVLKSCSAANIKLKRASEILSFVLPSKGGKSQSFAKKKRQTI